MAAPGLREAASMVYWVCVLSSTTNDDKKTPIYRPPARTSTSTPGPRRRCTRLRSAQDMSEQLSSGRKSLNPRP